jgi:hypothetical protein
MSQRFNTKRGDEPKILGIDYYNGCVWAQNRNESSQTPWKGKWLVWSKDALPSERLKVIYQNHLTPLIEYPGVVMPCPHHLRAIGGLVTTNSIAYPKSQEKKLHFPPNCWVGRDQKSKCIHEGKTFHVSIKS